MTLQKNEILYSPISKAYYAIVDPLANEISSIIENVITKTVSVNFEPTFDWKEIYGTKETIAYEEPETQEVQGSIFAQKLTLNYPGDSVGAQTLLTNINQVPVIIKMQFLYGSSKLLGSIENPLFIGQNFSSLANVTTRELFFLRNSEKQAPYIV